MPGTDRLCLMPCHDLRDLPGRRAGHGSSGGLLLGACSLVPVRSKIQPHQPGSWAQPGLLVQYQPPPRPSLQSSYARHVCGCWATGIPGRGADASSSSISEWGQIMQAGRLGEEGGEDTPGMGHRDRTRILHRRTVQGLRGSDRGRRRPFFLPLCPTQTGDFVPVLTMDEWIEMNKPAWELGPAHALPDVLVRLFRSAFIGEASRKLQAAGKLVPCAVSSRKRRLDHPLCLCWWSQPSGSRQLSPPQ